MEETVAPLTIPQVHIGQSGTTVYFVEPNLLKPTVKTLNPSDDELKGVEIGLDDTTIVYIKFHLDCPLPALTPSVKSLTKRSMLHVRFKIGYKQDYSLEVDELNEDLVFDFDKKNRIIGFVVCALDRLPKGLVESLSPSWVPFLVVTSSKNDENEKEEENEDEDEEGNLPKKSRRRPLQRTQFLLAACDGNLEKMKEIYSENPDSVNDIDVQGANAVVLSAGWGKLDVFKWLVSEIGCDINSVTNNKADGFMRAASHGHIHILDYICQFHLEKEGVPKDLNYGNRTNDSPIMFASSNGQLETVKWLYARGADVNYQSRSKSTCIHRAAVGGYLETIKWLFEQGCCATSETKRNQTPLHFAARGGFSELSKWFVEVVGADVSIKDNKRHTAAQIAALKGYEELARWLEAKEQE